MVLFHVLELIFILSGHFTLSELGCCTELITTYTMECGKASVTPGYPVGLDFVGRYQQKLQHILGGIFFKKLCHDVWRLLDRGQYFKMAKNIGRKSQSEIW